MDRISFVKRVANFPTHNEQQTSSKTSEGLSNTELEKYIVPGEISAPENIGFRTSPKRGMSPSVLGDQEIYAARALLVNKGSGVNFETIANMEEGKLHDQMALLSAYLRELRRTKSLETFEFSPNSDMFSQEDQRVLRLMISDQDNTRLESLESTQKHIDSLRTSTIKEMKPDNSPSQLSRTIIDIWTTADTYEGVPQGIRYPER